MDFNIRKTIRGLAENGSEDPKVTYRMTTCAANLNQDHVCFSHNFLTAKGIVITENIDRSRDAVPKENQLAWSDYIFFTYRQMKKGDVKNGKYIFQHSITEGTEIAIVNVYANLQVGRDTELSWTHADTTKRVGFLAILETCNAQGNTYLLTQHADAMGKKNTKQNVTLP